VRSAPKERSRCTALTGALKLEEASVGPFGLLDEVDEAEGRAAIGGLLTTVSTLRAQPSFRYCLMCECLWEAFAVTPVPRVTTLVLGVTFDEGGYAVRDGHRDVHERDQARLRRPTHIDLGLADPHFSAK
jgi:hypothetical protein